MNILQKTLKNTTLLQAGVDPAQLGQRRATITHKNKKRDTRPKHKKDLRAWAH